jgi:hypothetical protein
MNARDTLISRSVARAEIDTPGAAEFWPKKNFSENLQKGA